MSLQQTVWSYSDRTLSNTAASSPTNITERIAAAVWSYPTRTLTEVFIIYGIIKFGPIVLIDGVSKKGI